jgi:hypothetical protein
MNFEIKFRLTTKVETKSQTKQAVWDVQLTALNRHPPDPDKIYRFEDLFCIRKGVSLYDSASVAAIILHFKNCPILGCPI